LPVEGNDGGPQEFSRRILGLPRASGGPGDLEFDDQSWRSTRIYWVDIEGPNGLNPQLRGTGTHQKDTVDKPDRPPEPVAQVRVLPGARNFLSRGTPNKDLLDAAGPFCPKLDSQINPHGRSSCTQHPASCRTSGCSAHHPPPKRTDALHWPQLRRPLLRPAPTGGGHVQVPTCGKKFLASAQSQCREVAQLEIGQLARASPTTTSQ
jgi:hypothetical protein